VLLSFLYASAVSPVVAASAGVTGAAAVAGAGVVSCVGGGVLSTVIASALDRMRERGGKAEPSPEDLEEGLEEGIAGQIQEILSAGGADAEALRTEIAGVLEAVDAGGTALRAAIKVGSEEVRGEVVAVFGALGDGFAELRFLLGGPGPAVDGRMPVPRAAAFHRGGSGGVLWPGAADRGACGQAVAAVGPGQDGDRDRGVGDGQVLAAARGPGACAGPWPTAARLAGLGPDRDDPWRAGAGHPPGGAGRRQCRRGPGRPVRRSGECAPCSPAGGPLRRRPPRRGEAGSGSGARLVLIVDQFEQVFTPGPGDSGDPGQQAFITALCAGPPARPGHGASRPLW
jgi:hypothetical protein